MRIAHHSAATTRADSPAGAAGVPTLDRHGLAGAVDDAVVRCPVPRGCAGSRVGAEALPVRV